MVVCAEERSAQAEEQKPHVELNQLGFSPFSSSFNQIIINRSSHQIVSA